jgi:flagellar hook-associated protein 3 FlgL
MSFRITQGTLSRTTLSGLQANLTRLQHVQQQLSSGKRVSKPSDSPIDTVSAMQLRADKQRTEQFSRNIDDGIARLGAADSALTQVNDMLTRVRQLVVSGLNSTNGPDERGALADEVDQLRQGVLASANTEYLGRPVFAGTQSTTVAFDPVSGAYLGNDQLVKRSVSADPGSGTVPVNVPGSEVFTNLLGAAAPGPPATGGILAVVSAALRSGDISTLGNALGQLDTASAAMSSSHSVIGARYNGLQRVQTTANFHLDAVASSLSDAESIDLPRTIIEMQLQQNAYQAALGVTAKIVQPSLMDFLK